MHSYAFEQLLVCHTFIPMSELKLLLTGLAFAYKRLLVFLSIQPIVIAKQRLCQNYVTTAFISSTFIFDTF